MVATIVEVEQTHQLDDGRVPLAPAEKSSNVARKPRNREVSSRYKSSLQAPPQAPGRRFPSPNIGRTPDAAEAPKRAVSAERRRDEASCWASSSSSQLPQSPALSSIQANGLVEQQPLRPNGVARPRKVSPEKKRNSSWRQGSGHPQAENARPFENLVCKPELLKWPGSKSISKSMDLSSDRRSSSKPSRQVVHAISLVAAEQQEMATTKLVQQAEVSTRKEDTKCVRRLLDQADLGSCCESEGEAETASLASLERSDQQVRAAEDAGPQAAAAAGAGGGGRLAQAQPGPRPRTVRGTDVPARFWQDLGGRMRRLSDVNHLRSSLPEGEMANSTRTSRKQPKVLPPPMLNTPANVLPSPTWSLSPVRSVPGPVVQHPGSPSASSKTSSPSRTLPSPTRGRCPMPPNSTQRPSSVACMLNFGVDTSSKGRKALSQQEEAHYLRILHNRWLQWRFVNARSQAALESQKTTAERILYSASKQISDLRGRVSDKRIKYQQARQEEKVDAIITAHEKHLEEWGTVEEDHSLALSGTVEALEAATLRVPIIGGAKIDIQALKQALDSTADVIASLQSSAESLLPKADKTNGLVSELALVAAQERAVLQECGELLDRIAALETEDRSLRSYFVQLETEMRRPGSFCSDGTVN